MTKYFSTPFGNAGDLTPVPNSEPIDGSVSYSSGFGPDYALQLTSSSDLKKLPKLNLKQKFSALELAGKNASKALRDGDPDALAISRTQFNQILNDITTVLQQIQQDGVPNFITSADNGGVPFPYREGALVVYNGVTYISNVGSNTDTPPSANWSQLEDANGQISYLITSAGLVQDFIDSTLAKAVANYNINGALTTTTSDGINFVGTLIYTNRVPAANITEGSSFLINFNDGVHSSIPVSVPAYLSISGVNGEIVFSGGNSLNVGELKNYAPGSLSPNTWYIVTYRPASASNPIGPIWVITSDSSSLYTLKVSDSDLIASFLENKIVAGNGVSVTTSGSTGTNQSLIISTKSILNTFSFSGSSISSGGAPQTLFTNSYTPTLQIPCKLIIEYTCRVLVNTQATGASPQGLISIIRQNSSNISQANILFPPQNGNGYWASCVNKVILTVVSSPIIIEIEEMNSNFAGNSSASYVETDNNFLTITELSV